MSLGMAFRMRLAAVVFALGACVAPFASASAAETVDDLVAKHVAARGGLQALRAISSLSSTGKMLIPGFNVEVGYKEIVIRPGSARVDVSIQGLTAVQAYDGTTAWQIQPFQGRKDPEKMTADDAKQLQDMADFEDALVDYKAKGNTVEYLGTQDVDGAPAYVLRAKLRDGDVQTYYLDPDAMLAVRVESLKVVRGAEVQTVSDLGDYEKVAGVYFPFEISTGQRGSSQRTLITLDKVVANGNVPASLFSFPAGR